MNDWMEVENDLFERIRSGMPLGAALKRFVAHVIPATLELCYIPDEQYGSHRLHAYYLAPDIAPADLPCTGGVIECEQLHDSQTGWRRGVVQWRILNERDCPRYYKCMPLAWLERLSVPAPSRAAEAWRHVNWSSRKMQVPIYVGMGVTYYVGSDRYPLVVIQTAYGRKGIEVMPVAYHLVEGDILSEYQKYDYGAAYGNQTHYIQPSRRKAEQGMNRWRFAGDDGGYYLVGSMDAYRDPHY